MGHLPNDTGEILRALNISDVGELYKEIPGGVLKETTENLEEPFSEKELIRQFQEKSQSVFSGLNFLGWGFYSHEIPSVVDHLGSIRSFVTSYTPYQPEVAQGTLQALFEFQSLMASLTSLDIANASLYDGATALVEAIRMALRAKPPKMKSAVLLSEGIQPETMEILNTYFTPQILEDLNVSFVTVGLNEKTGSTDWGKAQIDGLSVVMAAFQNPNCYGVIEKEIAQIKSLYPDAALLYGTNDPLIFTLSDPPVELGVDIIWGEAQSLGMPLSFGGPGLGFMAAQKKYLRQMPGRLVGKTGAKDVHGEETEAFVITLSTREQHIRREKATSNICSNQTLMALRAAMFLSYLGWENLQKMAIECVKNARYFQDELKKKNISPLFEEADYFHEIPWVVPEALELSAFYGEGVAPGKETLYGDQKICVSYFSDLHQKEEIDQLFALI